MQSPQEAPGGGGAWWGVLIPDPAYVLHCKHSPCFALRTTDVHQSTSLKIIVTTALLQDGQVCVLQNVCCKMWNGLNLAQGVIAWEENKSLSCCYRFEIKKWWPSLQWARGVNPDTISDTTTSSMHLYLNGAPRCAELKYLRLLSFKLGKK